MWLGDNPSLGFSVPDPAVSRHLLVSTQTVATQTAESAETRDSLSDSNLFALVQGLTGPCLQGFVNLVPMT